jgi:uncharacterized protein
MRRGKRFSMKDRDIAEREVELSQSNPMRDFAFTTAVTVASHALILRDKLLGRVRSTPPNDPQSPLPRRHSIASGREVLDAVFVSPARKPVRAALLICHGIGETVDHWLLVQRILASDGVASLVFDYSGFGRSTGFIHWRQCEKDAIAAFEALKLLLPNTPISLLGFSLGSGVAAAILDSVSAHNLILCSSFTSFHAAARHAGLPDKLGFLVPRIWNSKESLRRRSLPILILHSANDRLFPVPMALNLALSCHEQSRFVVVPNHQHNDPFYRPQREYWEQVVSMLVDAKESCPGVLR